MGRFRWFIVGLLASAGCGLLTLASIFNAAFAFGDGDKFALIMAGTGPQGGSLPSGMPSDDFVAGVVSRYIDPAAPFFSGQPIFPGFTAVPLATPEQDAPTVGTLTLEESIAQGVINLHTAITQTYAGDDLVVFGYSQSAAIAALEMAALAASGQGPNPTDLRFVLIGANSPESGMGSLQTAFPGMTSGAVPPDTPYPTDIYTLQYDGLADFCQYPINLLCDINAGMGMAYHLTYPTLTPGQLAAAVELPTSPDYYDDGGVTHYYFIPSDNLPLLGPLQLIEQLAPELKPVIQPIIELIQPTLTYLVNLGYQDPYTTYADVLATTSLFPEVNPITFVENLLQNAINGVYAMLGGQLADAPQLSVLVPGWGNLIEFGDDIFGSLRSELSPLLAELSTGPVGQAVTDFGINVAYTAASLFATWAVPTD